MQPGYLDAYTHADAEKIYPLYVCEKMGWTLDYWRSLSEEDRDMVEAYLTGVAQAAKEATKK